MKLPKIYYPPPFNVMDRLGSISVDCRIHSRYGKRKFKPALQYRHNLEVNCSIDCSSTDGKTIAKIVKMEIFGHQSCFEEQLASELYAAMG